MSIDTAALRALAERAIQGPWRIDEQNVVRGVADGYVAEVWYTRQATAEYVAACSPDVLIALLDEVEAGRADTNRLQFLAAHAYIAGLRTIRDGFMVLNDEDEASDEDAPGAFSMRGAIDARMAAIAEKSIGVRA